jgi:hypothetical protein
LVGVLLPETVESTSLVGVENGLKKLVMSNLLVGAKSETNKFNNFGKEYRAIGT